MGLFGSKKKKRTYGQSETDALQPGLLQSYADIMRSGGGPETWLHRAPLNAAIQGAYERAARDLGAAGIDPTGLQARRNVDVNSLYGQIGQGMNQAKMGATGNMASYISNLTSGRPSAPTGGGGLDIGSILGAIGMLAKAIPTKQPAQMGEAKPIGAPFSNMNAGGPAVPYMGGSASAPFMGYNPGLGWSSWGGMFGGGRGGGGK